MNGEREEEKGEDERERWQTHARCFCYPLCSVGPPRTVCVTLCYVIDMRSTGSRGRTWDVPV